MHLLPSTLCCHYLCQEDQGNLQLCVRSSCTTCTLLRSPIPSACCSCTVLVWFCLFGRRLSKLFPFGPPIFSWSCANCVNCLVLRISYCIKIVPLHGEFLCVCSMLFCLSGIVQVYFCLSCSFAGVCGQGKVGGYDRPFDQCFKID